MTDRASGTEVSSGVGPTDAGSIEVNHLYKIYGPRPADILAQVEGGADKDEVQAGTGHTVGLCDINLSIRRAETFVVMGLSGCGKSTFVRCVNRLIDPTAGEVLIDGTDIVGLSSSDNQIVTAQ